MEILRKESDRESKHAELIIQRGVNDIPEQVLTIKPKFVVDNQTGMAIEVKQKGSPDLDTDPYYGGDRRCSCRLDVNQR